MKIQSDFFMHDFTRLMWADKSMQREYEQIINQGFKIHNEMDVASVANNLYPIASIQCILQTIPDMVERIARQGLIAIPIKANVPKSFNRFDAKADTYYCIIAKSVQKAIEYVDAFNAQDWVTMAALRGLPTCCQTFYHICSSQNIFDPIWQSATNSVNEVVKPSTRKITVTSCPELNPLLRYLGITMLGYVPHSLHCKPSMTLVSRRVELASSINLAHQIDVFIEMLSWPMEWSVLHGIAEIKTPLFKLATNSMATLDKWSVQIQGQTSPKEQLKGLVFPYNLAIRDQLRSESISAKYLNETK